MNTMEFRFSTDATALRTLFHAVLAMNDEADFRVTKKRGLYSVAVDPAHVAMVESHFRVNEWHFVSKDRGASVIAFDVASAQQAVKRVAAKGPIHIEITDRNLLVISANEIKRSMWLLDTAERRFPKIPNLGTERYVFRGSVSRQFFLRAALSAQDLTDAIHIKATPSTLQFFTDETEAGASYAIIFAKDIMDMEYGSAKEVNVSIPLDYLVTVLRAAPAERIRVHVADECPLILESSLQVRDENRILRTHGSLKFFIAPRIGSA